MPRKSKPPYTTTVRYIARVRQTKTEIIYRRQSEKVVFSTPAELRKALETIEDREKWRKEPSATGPDRTFYDSVFTFVDSRGKNTGTQSLANSIIRRLKVDGPKEGYDRHAIARVEKAIFSPHLLPALEAAGKSFSKKGAAEEARRLLHDPQYADLRRAIAVQAIAHVARSELGYLNTRGRSAYGKHYTHGEHDIVDLFLERQQVAAEVAD